MPVDPAKALGAELPESKSSYNKDEVILYHLGVGAGDPATDAGELAYTYEKDLKVLPSFAVIPAFGSMGGIAGIPGLEFDFAMLLHGEQEVILHRPLPPEAELTNKSRIAEIWDKGKAALVVLESTSSDAEGPLFTNRFSLFLRGEGGFGGESGPKAGNKAPERAPDGVVERKLLPKPVLDTENLEEAGKLEIQKPAAAPSKAEEKAALKLEEERLQRKRRNAERKKKLRERGV